RRRLRAGLPSDRGVFDTFRLDAGERTGRLYQLRHRRTCPAAAAGGPAVYVSVYSGPEPPSGGVRRPPFAVIAPHCTQFDGVTLTVTTSAPSPPPPPPPLLPSPPATSYTCAGHMRTHISASVRGTSVCTRMWLGWSSRVRFPERKTDDSLSNVSLPSGAGYRDARSVTKSSCSASRSVGRSPNGTRPRVPGATPADSAPPPNPPTNRWRPF